MSNLSIDDKLQACECYLQVATDYVVAREEYRLRFSMATQESQAKTEAQRKAEVDIATSNLRLRRDHLELEAAVAWQQLLIARGPMTDSIQPLQKFGDR
jgi:hypothetical protein